jgi:hypothetical protein
MSSKTINILIILTVCSIFINIPFLLPDIKASYQEYQKYSSGVLKENADNKIKNKYDILVNPDDDLEKIL